MRWSRSQHGKPHTTFLIFGDRVRIEMFGRDGASIFGAIDQKVVEALPGPAAADRTREVGHHVAAHRTGNPMFEILDRLPPDPILGVTAAFRAMPRRTRSTSASASTATSAASPRFPPRCGMPSRRVLAAQTTKSYVGPLGNLEFNARIVELALGPLAAPLRTARQPSRPLAAAAPCASAPN